MGRYTSIYTGEQIDKRLSDVDTKIAATHFDAAAMVQYGFASVEDRDRYLESGDESLVISSCPFEFTGTQRRVQVINRMESNQLYFAENTGKAEITVGFLSQEKGISDTQWMEVMEDFTVSVWVDKWATGNWTSIIENRTVLSGNDLLFDVYKYIQNGQNRVRIMATGATSGAVGNLILNVNRTSMYLIDSNFAWNRPFIEGETYALGGMNIGGNIPKIMYITITGNNGETEQYEENLGTKTYTNVAYYYTGLSFPKAGTGTYHVDIWLDANGLESEHLEYDIMCVAQSDVNTAQLVCINSISTNASNWSDAELFKYSVYDKGSASASPSISLRYGNTVLTEETLEGVATSAINTYSASLEIDSEVSELELSAAITLGESTKAFKIKVDNTLSFPAVGGNVFYMNATTRNNNQENKGSIVNEVDGSLISMTTEGIAYADGIDGWTVDDEGRKCLLIPACCKATIDYRPLANVGNAKTIELCYKIAHVANYDENVITMAVNPEEATFRGIRVKPKNICVHSRDKNTDDLAQSYNAKDEEMVHLLITIIKGYKTNYGNLCQIYVNGVKKTSFSFTDTDSFVASANLILGCLSSDLYLYKMRVYNVGFGWQDAVQNYINCLPDRDSKVAASKKIHEVVDDSYNMDYDACVKAGYNTMVIEMKQGSLPDVLHPSSGTCDVTFNFPDVIESELDEDFKNFFSGNTLTDQVIDGQGTTSMTYYRWNFRWKLSKTYNKRRITAKKNYASSMHSHKMGCTRMYNDLHNTVVGSNDAAARVAVFQYPAYGFLKTLIDGTTDQYVYTFIGLYTVGPDKGDSTTFGFNNPEFESSIMDMEGTDHTPMGVGFDYPWNSMGYDYAKEGFGAITSNGSIATAYEVGSAGSLSPDNAADQDAVWSMIESEFKPAYEVVYNNSTCILGVTDTLEAINSNISSWRSQTTSEGKPYSELEFWTDGVYDLYYFNVQNNRFESNGINLLTQFSLSTTDLEGLSINEKNELFKSKRREAFKIAASNYWNIDDLLFHDIFLLLFGATDNGKKNTYPYKLKLLSDGGRWQWRQDDLDSVLDINNQGFAAKQYSLLYGDTTSSGSVFRGENSVLRTLVRECFVDETKQMVHRILDAMVSLSPYGSNKIDKLIGYVKENLWDKAQNYFSKSGYNADAEWSYEEAWPLKTSGAYVNDVDPLQQSLGDHYEAEKDWVELRMVFIASYFGWGPFAVDNGDDKSTGQVSFRAASGYTYSITPAIDFNPTILIGQSDSVSAGNRILAGNSTDIVVPDMGNNDTHIYIQGTDYLSDIGDLKDLQVSADNPVLSVSSKRMKILKVGDELAENVTSNITTLELGYSPCMEEIDARNLSTLTSSIDLSRLPRLRKALFKGTSSPNINIGKGNKIEQLSLPDTITTLSLVSLPLLTEETLDYGTLGNVSYLRVEDNKFIDSFELLKLAYTNSTNLSYIRIIGFDYSGTANDINMLIDLAEAVDENENKKYFGIDAEGNVTDGIPVIEGTLTVGKVYESTLEKVSGLFPNINIVTTGVVYVEFADPEVQRICAENWGDGTGITTEQIEAVTDIGTKFKGNTVIETFDEFEKFIGISDVGSFAFADCSNLKSINIPKHINFIQEHAFINCASLSELTIPNNINIIGRDAFKDCTSLSIDLTDKLLNITELGANSFKNSKVCGIINMPKVTSIGNISQGDMFYGTNISEINIGGNVELIPYEFCNNCSKLNRLTLGESIKTIYSKAFMGCDIKELNLPYITHIIDNVFSYNPNLKKVILPSIVELGSDAFTYDNALELIDLGANCTKIANHSAFVIPGGNYTLISRAITPPALGGGMKQPKVIYVPDASVEAYKTATNWITYADRIKSMFYYLGYIDFVDPAVRDICVANFDTDGDGVVSIEEAAAVTDIGTIFQDNTEITSFDEFKYFTGVTSISGNFYRCTNLTSITLPDSITSIDSWSGNFYGTKIEELTLPPNLNLTGNPFNGMPLKRLIITGTGNVCGYNLINNPSFEQYIIKGENSKYKIVDDCLFSVDGTILYGVPQTKTSIPDLSNVNTLEDGAFAALQANIDVVLPSSITSGHNIFREAKIRSITALGLITLNQGSIFNCSNLIKADFYVLENIRYYVFGNSPIEILILRTNKVVSISSDSGLPTTCIIYVPDELVDDYKASTEWTNYIDNIKPLSEYAEE